MYVCFADPEYYIIFGSMVYDISNGNVGLNSPDLGMTFKRISPISKTECITYHFDNLDNTPFTSQSDFLYRADNYIYDGTSFSTRPYFTVEVITPDIDLEKVQLNVDISVKIVYNDPDNVKFNDIITSVSFKDKFDFITLSITDVNIHDLSNVIIPVKSSYPGVALLRAKDNLSLCRYQTLSMRFKQ